MESAKGKNSFRFTYFDFQKCLFCFFRTTKSAYFSYTLFRIAVYNRRSSKICSVDYVMNKIKQVKKLEENTSKGSRARERLRKKMGWRGVLACCLDKQEKKTKKNLGHHPVE